MGDLDVQGHLAISTQNPRKWHSKSLLFIDLGRPREWRSTSLLFTDLGRPWSVALPNPTLVVQGLICWSMNSLTHYSCWNAWLIIIPLKIESCYNANIVGTVGTAGCCWRHGSARFPANETVVCKNSCFLDFDVLINKPFSHQSRWSSGRWSLHPLMASSWRTARSGRIISTDSIWWISPTSTRVA